MRTQGRVRRRAMSTTRARAIAGSRYSSTYFIGLLWGQTFFGELAHGLEGFVRGLGLSLVDARDGVADVHENVIADGGFGNQVKAHAAEDAAKLNAADTAAVYVIATKHLAGHGETHGGPPAEMMAGGITSGCDSDHRRRFT